MYILWKSSQMTNKQIGQRFGLSYPAVSHAVKQLKARLPANPELQTKFEQLNSQFKL
jgi:DNA-binding CsgD family transcriptional regulator